MRSEIKVSWVLRADRDGYIATYVGLLCDPAKNIAVGHDNDVLLGSAAKVLTHPLGTIVQGGLVGSVEALLASPVGGQGREVEALELRVSLEHLLGGTSVTGEVVAFLQLGQEHNLAQATQTLDKRSVANLGALQRTLESRRENDFGARLQVLRQRWQSSRLLLSEGCQWCIWDRVVVGDVLH